MILDVTIDDHFECEMPNMDANASTTAVVNADIEDSKEISFVFFLILK